MSESLVIQSHKGEYIAAFDADGISVLNSSPPEDCFVIIDKKIVELYGDRLGNLLAVRPYLAIEAIESNKSLDKFQVYIEHLVEGKVRRGQQLIAIGGGIIQDITCFIATTMMRGLPWVFYPTTLLAQADSCIGSKSSINVGKIKNILGTFTPPNKIIIDTSFLETLSRQELCSGIGEMLKVHAIKGPASFDEISLNYGQILDDQAVMEEFIFKSLKIKQKIVELDEFDVGPRNVMNYGHSFGHAIESATNFGVPHGVAVTIGADMANFVAASLGVSTLAHFERMHPVLAANYSDFGQVDIPADDLLTALAKDKKNTSSQLRLILPDKEGVIGIGLYDNSEEFRAACKRFLATVLPAGQ